MHYFSLHTPQVEHLGFFIMLPDHEHERPAQSGRFIIKLQSESPLAPALQTALHAYQDPAIPLYWTVQQDHVNLFDEHHQPIGTIRNEYLTLNGQSLLLNDMTGLM